METSRRTRAEREPWHADEIVRIAGVQLANAEEFAVPGVARRKELVFLHPFEPRENTVRVMESKGGFQKKGVLGENRQDHDGPRSRAMGVREHRRGIHGERRALALVSSPSYGGSPVPSLSRAVVGRGGGEADEVDSLMELLRLVQLGEASLDRPVGEGFAVKRIA